MEGRQGVQRATLSEAAQLLGISKGAVRQRVRRKTLRSDKGEDGRVYVYVDPSVDDVHDRDHDRHQDDRYTRSLEEQVEYLRGQLDQERTASAELRRIVAGLTQRIPELEPARDERESPETATPDAGRVEDQDRRPTPQTATQSPQAPRSLWSRIFGR